MGLLQGGFIPDLILYLSYFFKGTELPFRLAILWTATRLSSVVAPLLAYGVLRLRGHNGYEGWRWLFLTEGLLNFVIACWSMFSMAPSPTQTKAWWRPQGWFTEQEEKVLVNRILRDDPSKGGMHNRQALTPKFLWESLCDYDLWPLYFLGLTFLLPAMPPNQYLTLTLRELGFDTLTVSLLTIPAQVGTTLNVSINHRFPEFFLNCILMRVDALHHVDLRQGQTKSTDGHHNANMVPPLHYLTCNSTRGHKQVGDVCPCHGVTILPESTSSPDSMGLPQLQLCSNTGAFGLSIQHLRLVAVHHWLEHLQRRRSTRIPSWKPGPHWHRLHEYSAVFIDQGVLYVEKQAKGQGVGRHDDRREVAVLGEYIRPRQQAPRLPFCFLRQLLSKYSGLSTRAGAHSHPKAPRHLK